LTLKGIMDIGDLQKFQDSFCEITNIFMFCVDEDGEKLTHMSGDGDEINTLLKVLDVSNLIGLYKRVSESALEDQVIEDTQYENLKIIAVCYKQQAAVSVCWLACAVIEDESIEEVPEVLSAVKTRTTPEQLQNSMDLLSLVTRKLFQANYSAYRAEAEKRRSLYSESEMSEALKRAEALANVVQLLEGSESFEEVTAKVLEISGTFLEISAAELYQITKDGSHIDLIGEWRQKGILKKGDYTKNLEREALFQVDKPLVISSDTKVSDSMSNSLIEAQLKAVVNMPLFISGTPAMYVLFREEVSERVWRLEDIRFMNDVTKILQSMLTKRIQKNSLASSYASLQAILDHVGSAIHVKEPGTGKVLFQNKVLKSTFDMEIKTNTLDELLENARPLLVKEGYYEVNHMASRKWYDLRKTSINWVDGSQVTLNALYDITDKKIYQRKIEQQAYTDFLTGLYNRMCCERDLACHIDKAKKYKKVGGLLYLDLDDFKHINDGLGHQYGDVLLKAISHSLQRIRGIENTCYRMGGDEFVIIIPSENYSRFQQIIKEISDIFSKPWFLKDADYYCTMSMGIVSFPEDGDSVQDLIKKADIAMYEAKKSGKNRVARYSNSITSASSKRLDMEKNMRDATTSGYKEFEVYYQPIIDIQKEDSPCTGAEALIRWNSSVLGFIPPSDFIPLAEYLGLINPIGNHVLTQACIACKGWNDKGYENYKVNVNLSVVQLLQPDIVDIVERTIIETGINPKNLTLEVTESLAINDMRRMKTILSSIRKLGVRIALDDFGTGYSALNHIREIPLDVIKVDQSFVSDLAEDNYSQSFIKMVGELASAIGVSICVEGIETADQYKVLEGMKVRLVQGYYFDRPMPQEMFEKKYVL